jgi:putative SOS response-associated peptidase YedK
MPVVFTDHELWQAWLDRSLDSAAARELLAPLPSDPMVVRATSPLVNSARHEGRTALPCMPRRRPAEEAADHRWVK